MNTIKGTATDQKTLLEALKGDYGTSVAPNGMVVTKAGRIVQYWGAFNDSAEVVEIPVLPERHPVTFTGDDFACCAIAEAGSGFVSVPEAAKGKRFVVFATCLLNT